MTGQNGSLLSGINAGGGAVSSIAVNNVIGKEIPTLVTASVNTTVNNSQTISSIAYSALAGTAASGVSLAISNSQGCINNLQRGFVDIQNASTSLTLNGNTFYAGATQGYPYEMVNFTAASTTFAANNNVFDSGIAGTYAYDFGSYTGSIYTGNNNAFVSPNVASWLLSGTTYSSLAAWKTASGQDSNSITTGSGISACTLRTP
jgi:hypothetical protein